MASGQGTALVTGAAGFIGAHVTRALLAEGRVHVVALDDLSGGFRDNLPDGTEFIEGSVADADLVRRVFATHRITHVFHLAAYAAEGLSHFIRRFNYTNNVIGSVNLVNEAVRHEVECFVFTSSIAVYGPIPSPMREGDRPMPEDPYGVAKLAVELDLAAAERMFGLPYVVFRPHNVYGEYQNLGDPYRNVIGIFMNQIMQGEPMSIFGDGTQQRAFSYVGDIVPAIARSPWVPEARNQVFNIGAERPYTVLELARTVGAAMGAPGHPIQHFEARHEVHTAYSDHSKAARVFGSGGPWGSGGPGGVVAQTTLDAGVQRMAAWARTVGARAGKPFEGVEIARNLPARWRQITDLSRS
jgi:UDP-glucose 4-epimerase